MENYIGKRLSGRYELLKLIGSGGMANVFEAKDLAENKIVAIKLLKQEYLTNDEFVRRFRNESKVIAVLDHPNIVKVYDVNFTGADQYIVMEYIDGITLKQYITHQGHLRWKDSVYFVTQILRALAHAHEHGVIHRDIKSQNIMLLRDGTIKVMDFGIARFAREDIRTMEDKAIGSVHYISPEQACGEESDEKSDIYSVGVLLYEMLTGRVPFDGETPEQVAMKHIQKKPIPVATLQPDVPTGLCEIVEKAMQKDKNLRYRSASEMLSAIDAFKHNPGIVFEYKYMPDEPEATKYYRSVSAIQAEEQSGGGRKRSREAEKEEDEEIIIKRSPTILILTGIAAACVITAILVLLGFFYWGRDEKVPEIAMPNLVGMYLDDVRQQEEYKNFKFQIVENELSEYPKGQIYDQSVTPGVMVKVNRTIKIKVSAGIEVLEVPELTNWYVGDAEDELSKLGLDHIVRTQEDSSVEADHVIRTDPPAGQQVEQGTQVVLYVSRPKTDTVVKVPKVIGYTLENAQEKLIALGFVVETEEVDSDEAPGTVLDQDKANTYAKKGDTIKLTVSNGSGYFKEAVLTVVFPQHAVSKEYSIIIYVDGEEVLNEMVNPAEAGIEKTYPLKGNGVMPVVVSIDGQKYASFDVNFDDGSAALTDGYYFDVIETDGEGPDGGESSGESSGSGESSESGESSQPEESESSQEGGDNPLDAPQVD